MRTEGTEARATLLQAPCLMNKQDTVQAVHLHSWGPRVVPPIGPAPWLPAGAGEGGHAAALQSRHPPSPVLTG